MRTAPASVMKGHKGAALQTEPKLGSRLRRTYDCFKASPGIPMEFKWDGHGNDLRQLTDFYGLDIRRIRNGQWVLAGEWFGRAYIDYIAANLERSAA